MFTNSQFFNFYSPNHFIEMPENQIKSNSQQSISNFPTGFLESLPDLSKNKKQDVSSLKNIQSKNETGVIDFSNFPVTPKL